MWSSTGGYRLVSLLVGVVMVVVLGGMFYVAYTCVLYVLVWLVNQACFCLLYTSPSPRDRQRSRMPSSA